MHPLRRHSASPGAAAVVNRLHSRRELRAELWVLGLLHVALALGIWFAPEKLVVTPTNVSVFRLMPSVVDVHLSRLLWGLAFAACGSALLLLIWRPAIRQQFVAVAAVGFVNGLWLAAYALPLAVGHGSVIGTLVFTTLLLWPGFVIYRVAHGAGE